MFFKIYKNKSLFYFFKLIPEKTSSYVTSKQKTKTVKHKTKSVNLNYLIWWNERIENISHIAADVDLMVENLIQTKKGIKVISVSISVKIILYAENVMLGILV